MFVFLQEASNAVAACGAAEPVTSPLHTSYRVKHMAKSHQPHLAPWHFTEKHYSKLCLLNTTQERNVTQHQAGFLERKEFRTVKKKKKKKGNTKSCVT